MFNWFWYFVDISKNAFLFNNSSFQACIGKRRSGKSVYCLASAAAVDPDITEENICFTIPELKAQLNEKRETAIIWEEAGTSAYSRDFMEERNKTISKTLQVYAYRKIAIYGNFQHLKFLDGDIRLQLDCFMKMKAVNQFIDDKPFTTTFAYPYTVVTDYIQEPLIAPYKIARDGTYQAIGDIPLPQVHELFKITGVSKSLYKSYLRKKDEYFQDIGEEKKEEKEDIFTRRELKTLTRVNKSFIKLATTLINEDNIPKNKIASYAEIPEATLRMWLGKETEAEDFIERIKSSPALQVAAVKSFERN
jgi:hypothetical protein